MEYYIALKKKEAALHVQICNDSQSTITSELQQ